jgi:hypothetical protein
MSILTLIRSDEYSTTLTPSAAQVRMLISEFAVLLLLIVMILLITSPSKALILPLYSDRPVFISGNLVEYTLLIELAPLFVEFTSHQFE